MRRLLALTAALGLLAGLGCHHHVCEMCDYCGAGCNGPGVYIAPHHGPLPPGYAPLPGGTIHPGPKPEELKKPPVIKDDGPDNGGQ
jgi:hypothetical protein